MSVGLSQDCGIDKLGYHVDATYAPRTTCPSTCPLRESGCYGEHGRVRFHVERLAREAARLRAVEAAEREALLIDASWRGGRVPHGQLLRLHVYGDAKIAPAVRVLERASGRYLDRGGMAVWTYTHAWRAVLRRTWGRVSVLASIEKLEDAAHAGRRGYTPALVVESFRNENRPWSEGGVRWIPCRWQTERVSCRDCGLCMRANELGEAGTGIAFAAHGGGRKRVLRVLSHTQNVDKV